MKKILLFSLLFLSTEIVFGKIRLPRIFGDHMVLQRGQPIPVWGWADANEKVTVQFNKQTKNTKADKAGRWMIRLDPEPAGGPYQFVVKGKNSIIIKDVLVGEVWVCSGQSNMEFTVSSSVNAANEIAQADNSFIRHFKVPHAVDTTPRDDLDDGEWKISNAENTGDFAAVGYFFARELYNKLKVPVGLINTSWGGTHVETWTSKKAFEQSEEFKEMIKSMPSINIEEMAKELKDAMNKKIEALQGPLENSANIEHWKEISFDDNQWSHMKLPGYWEQQGLDNMDGVVWFRKTIDVSAFNAGKVATLELAKIDDSDDSYVNGIKVGSKKDRYDEYRRYTIPAGLLKAGKNVIAVRVEDTGGGGGIYGEPAEMKLTISDNTESLAGDWSYRVESIRASGTGIGPNSYPTLLFNAMLNPLIPYAIKGVLWYQGESNAGRAFQYRKAFPLMINDWRQHWQQGNFPFLFVQLANFNASNETSANGSTWAELREAQTLTLSLPNTGMSVTTDIGEANDIHPKNKQEVGRRLAAIAFNKVYNLPVIYSGPVYESMKIDGKKIIIHFSNSGSGLIVKDKYGYLKGFEIAGDDQKFHFAKAYIEGSDIVVYKDEINNPVAVRYAWADNPEDANLYNKENFPAGSFRTDKWKGITEGARFIIGK
jgi:sialate O-acetylesterase